MNTRQFDYVLAVAALKNFSQAADKCFITQSTLSTMIGRFEQEIGIQIFDRKTKPVTITKEGAEIIAHLKVIRKEIRGLEERAQGIRGEQVGALKLGVIPTVAPYLLPSFLNDFAKKTPKMHLSVSEMTTDIIEELLEKRELDIGIFAIPIENKDLIEIPLYNEPFVLYDCTNTPAKTVESLDSIDVSKFWLLEEGHCLHTQVDAICKSQAERVNVGANFDFRAGSIESLIRFVKANKGITLLPTLACLDFPQEESEKLSYFSPPIPVRTIGLVVHRHFSKFTLLDKLKQEIQEKVNPLISSKERHWVVSPQGGQC